MSPSVEPFDELKYKALMDGLECSELMMSEIGKWNPIFRFDAEFYTKEAIRIDENIRNRPYFQLELDQVVSGPFGSALKSESYLQTGDIPFIRIENIRGGFSIDTSNIVYISSDDNKRIRNSEMRTDDIILSKVGNTIGFFARVNEKLSPCNISENNIGIRMSKYPVSQRKCILTYLNSKYAQLLVKRRTSGNAQPKLNVGDVCLIPIPLFSDSFCKLIAKLIDESENTLTYSGNKYDDAEAILTNSLDAYVDIPLHPVTAVKRLYDSFIKTGRLDAEYYQPKYEGITKSLHTTETVQSICNRIYDDNYVPQEDSEYRYIELANVGNNGIISDVETIAGRDLPSRARRKVREGQVIISSVEGSLQSCALITAEYDGALCSTGFFVLDSDRINSETLLVLFKSEPVQALLKQRCSGTILTAISKDELLNMPLPYIDEDIQKQIAAKIQESFDLRRKSKELLEYAKQAVEMAIELGEDTALTWLSDKVG